MSNKSILEQQIREELREERGMLCEWCRIKPWTDKHHAIIRRDIRFPELNVKINYMAICHDCHMTGDADTFEVQRLFYFLQEERGYDPQGWLDTLPLKIKPQFQGYLCNSVLLRISLAIPIKDLLLMDLIS